MFVIYNILITWYIETYNIKNKNKIKDYKDKFKIFSTCLFINHICILPFYSKIDNFLKYCVNKYDEFLIFDSLKISLLKFLNI